MNSLYPRIKVKSGATVFALTVFVLVAAFAGVAIPAQAQAVNTLYTFGRIAGDATFPTGTMAQGRDGNFYGISQAGPGTPTNNGVVYKISASGAISNLHTIQPSEGTQCNGLVLGMDGNFYGTCFSDPVNNGGTFFKVTPTGTFTVLHAFAPHLTNGDGCNPLSSPVLGKDGNFYGTTQLCGATAQFGMAYKITPAGVYTRLHSFAGGPTEVSNPRGLVQGSDGNFWGWATRAEQSAEMAGCLR